MSDWRWLVPVVLAAATWLGNCALGDHNAIQALQRDVYWIQYGGHP